MKELSLYIHIPFCRQKCYYCDFVSFTNKNDKIEGYINSLITELGLYKKSLENYTIKTIFIGGGTPSAIDSKYIVRILQYINENYKVDRKNEITIESNPGSLTREKIKNYKDAGINRISMGVQSLNDNLLESIGRSHKAEDFYRSYNEIRDIGIDNVNVDLIFGLPNQNLDLVLDSLEKAIDLDIKHISYYGLILEENTVFYKLYNEGKIILPNEEEEREMYYGASKYLISKGYNHYEISNYAIPSYECKHNLIYWDLKPYLGLGLNSHSYMEGERFFNTANLEKYMGKLNEGSLPVEERIKQDKKDEMEEFCIFGIRKIQGISIGEFRKRFGMEIEKAYENMINKHMTSGLIKIEDGFLSLTRKGLDLANLVEVDFLLD